MNLIQTSRLKKQTKSNKLEERRKQRLAEQSSPRAQTSLKYTDRKSVV